MSNPEQLKEFVEREIILSEGHENKNIFIVHEGLVKIQRKIDGKDITLEFLGKGRIFGESALINNDNKSFYTATAIENCKILVIEKELFHEIIKTDHEISFETLNQFGYNNKVIFLSFSDLLLKGDIAFMVTNLLHYRNIKGNSQKAMKDFLITKELMSELTCTHNEDLDRNIDILLKINVISGSGDPYLLSSCKELEKCLAILEMKRKRTAKSI
jgi:hypothetical protein